MTQTTNPKARRRLNILGWSWGGFDLLLVIGALLAGFLVWFLPDFNNTPEMRAFYANQKKLKAERLTREAEDARIAKENEELGIVYLPPPPPKTDSKPAPKSVPKAGPKPAPKKNSN